MSEMDRLNKIIEDHGLGIVPVQKGELRDISYLRVYDALAAKLAEVEAERDAARTEERAIANERVAYVQKCCDDRAEAAEAALVAAYRLALGDAADNAADMAEKRAGEMTSFIDDTASHEADFGNDISDTIRALATPTAAELMARIKKEKNDDQ